MSSSERTDRATALITGASSGIGYQYARQLAARGYDLLIVSNDAEGIANSAAEIRKQYGVRVTATCRPKMQPKTCIAIAKTSNLTSRCSSTMPAFSFSTTWHGSIPGGSN